MTPEISRALAELANKLGTSVEYLWPMMVKHEVATSVAGLIACLLVAAALFFSAYRMLRFFMSDKYVMELDFELALVGMVAILGVVFVCISLGEIPDIIVPEAAAIKSLLAK